MRNDSTILLKYGLLLLIFVVSRSRQEEMMVDVTFTAAGGGDKKEGNSHFSSQDFLQFHMPVANQFNALKSHN